MSLIDEAKHQLRFAQTLAWSTESCSRPDQLSNFNYPADDAKTSSFSATVLKTFDPIWFCKDYLFLNQGWFEDVAWLPRVQWVLVALFACSLLAVGFLAGRVRGGS